MGVPGLSAASSALKVAQRMIEIHAHNIANMNTGGYKKSDIAVSDVAYNVFRSFSARETQNSAIRPIGFQIGGGAKIDGTYRILDQGALKSTNNPLDIAIMGPGYFSISIPTAPNGRAFTRNGSFKIDAATGNIVTIHGDLLSDTITIPPGVNTDKLNIAKDGTVSYVDAANNEVPIGTITLYNFPNERGIEAIGNNMLVATESSGEAFEITDQSHSFIQNYLEESNVSPVDELTQLVSIQRAYDYAARISKIANEMAQKLDEIN